MTLIRGARDVQVGLTGERDAYVAMRPDGAIFSYSGGDNAPRLRETEIELADGDVVGCGVNWRRGVAFWALNGATFKEAEQPLRLDTSWCATVAATGEAEVAFNFGAKQPFAFDVLGLEERIWKDWRSDFSLRELFESCTPPELLDADERRRGWPWNQNDEWSATLDAWVRPWLQREAARAGGGGGGTVRVFRGGASLEPVALAPSPERKLAALKRKRDEVTAAIREAEGMS